jgi:hypothetical protein
MKRLLASLTVLALIVGTAPVRAQFATRADYSGCVNATGVLFACYVIPVATIDGVDRVFLGNMRTLSVERYEQTAVTRVYYTYGLAYTRDGYYDGNSTNFLGAAAPLFAALFVVSTHCDQDPNRCQLEGDPASRWTTSPGFSTAYVVTFTSTPEPVTLVLFATGVIAVVSVGRGSRPIPA